MVLVGLFMPDWNTGVCFWRRWCCGRKYHAWQTQEELLIVLSSMEMWRACSYKISLRHALNVCTLGPGSDDVLECNLCGHCCPHAAGTPCQSRLWALQDDEVECGRAWDESRGFGVDEVVPGINSGKYLSICPAQHWVGPLKPVGQGTS